MSGGDYVDERGVIATLLAANWTATPIYGPNESFQDPDPDPSRSSAAAYLAWDIRYEPPPRQITFDGTVEYRGYVDFGVWVEKDSGDFAVRTHVDSLVSIFEAVGGSALTFFEPDPGDAGVMGGWYGRLVSVPFVRFGSITLAEAAQLAGLGSTSVTISQASHGFSASDWLSYDSGTPQWQKALAGDSASEPRCEGVVSQVLDANTFILTLTGAVTLTSHGYSVGPLYIDQSTRGAATSTAPAIGEYGQRIATVIDANSLIVLDSEQILW